MTPLQKAQERAREEFDKLFPKVSDNCMCMQGGHCIAHEEIRRSINRGIGQKMLDSLIARTRKEAFEEAIAGIENLKGFIITKSTTDNTRDYYSLSREHVLSTLKALRDEKV